MNPEDPLAEQILGIQLIPSLPKLWWRVLPKGSPGDLLDIFHRAGFPLAVRIFAFARTDQEN